MIPGLFTGQGGETLTLVAPWRLTASSLAACSTRPPVVAFKTAANGLFCPASRAVSNPLNPLQQQLIYKTRL
jgi:hypothetical protein